MFGVFVGRPSTGSNVWILVTDTSYDLKKKASWGKKKKKKKIMLIRLHKLKEILVSRVMTHSIIQYVLM